jgi:LuxR family maltose regulon positive regulatory protein
LDHQHVYSPIISTKLHAPQYGLDLLPRPLILDELESAEAAKLILFCAPAGFGKTTIASQWIESLDCPVGWVSLDEQDNDPIRFWRYVAGALNNVQEGAGGKFSILLQSIYPPSVEKLIAILLDEIFAIHGSFYLVLDDYHLIKDQSVHMGMQYLIQHAPLSMHTIVISRNEPPFFLHRLRVRKQLKQLGMNELRFTEEDSSRFFNELMGLDLSKQDIRLLSKRTEGWIAGMQMAALSIKGKADASSFIQRFSGNDKYIEDYLSEEVLNQLPEAVQLFLLKTSVLSRLSGSLCTAVTGEPNAHAILRMLEQTNSFVITLDDTNEWYRYHQLFADILNGLLRQKYADQLPGLHIAASEWFERQGLMMEAIEHALSGNDWNRATSLIVAYAPWMLKQCETTTLRRWMQSFTQNWLKCHPDLCIPFAWLHTLTDEVDQAEMLLQFADQDLLQQDEKINDDCRVEIYVLRGYIEIMQKNVDHAVKYIEKSVQLRQRFSRYFQTGIELNSGEAYVLRSRLAVNGYLRKVNELFPKLRAILKHSGLPILGYGSIVMAELYYERNDFEQLMYFVPRAIELGKSTMNFGVLIPAYLTLIRWRKAKNRFSEMWLAVEEISALCRQNDASPHWISIIEAFRVRLWIEENRRLEIRQWLKRYSLHTDDELASRHEFEWMTLARVYIYLNKDRAALKLLTRLKHETEVKDRLGSRIECFLILNQVYLKQNKREAAIDCIRRAVSLASPEGYVRIFLDEKHHIAKQLHEIYINRSVTDEELEYISILLKGLHQEYPSFDMTNSESPVPDKLTERELELLGLIGGGLSNLEIAQKLHLSLGTVKGYVHQMFSKLRVRNRTQAIARMREIRMNEMRN